MRALLALAALALLAGPALAQAPEAPDEARNPTRIVTMYPHVFNIGSAGPMPGNTQFPKGEDDFSRGTYGPCMDGAAGAVLGACEENGINILYVYSTAGFVHADFDTFSYEQIHNERGQAKDILLDTTQDVTATFYMSADAHPWIPSTVIPENLATGVPSGMPVWNWDPGAHPDWRVEATLFLLHLGEYQGQASDPPPVQEMMDSEGGTLVAQGTSDPITVVSLDSNLNNGQGEVYEFAINLGKPQVDRIPKEMDWVMRFRWWSDSAGMHYQAPVSWNVNSGEFYPNRFTLPIKNPFDVELVYPQFLHDKLLVHAMLNSPWGSYDVDAKSVAIEVVDDANRPADFLTVSRVADFSVAHGGHYKPVNITWVWDYKADRARAGVYKATVTASNFQHSASSTTEALFRINADGTGTVLSIGRSGQQTSTEDQLDELGASASAGGDAPLPLRAQGQEARAVPAPPALVALAALGALVAARRGR